MVSNAVIDAVVTIVLAGIWTLSAIINRDGVFVLTGVSWAVLGVDTASVAWSHVAAWPAWPWTQWSDSVVLKISKLCFRVAAAAWLPGKVRDSVPKISNHTSFLLQVFVSISALLVSDLEMLLVPSFQCHVSLGLAALLRRRLDSRHLLSLGWCGAPLNWLLPDFNDHTSRIKCDEREEIYLVHLYIIHIL